MRTLRTAASVAGVVLAAVATAVPAAPAAAAPAPGVEVETQSQNTVDGVDYIISRITLAPGAETGWHYHPGEVFGFIRDGTLTHWNVPDTGGCAIDAIYPAGAPVKEGVGAGFVHNGRNEGVTPLVMEVTYINPAGTPLSVEVPVPAGCAVS
ncbi:MAG: cupin domain-containing protein [Mycobacteriaceae bacterium]|nr:cupin [Mycobacterium sp.]NBP85719.1 cupin domain-containing protein [Mycobacteriaceae bacterium]NBQ41407.1 cupin domain-containing protein [Mycobacteriaceae bacterium]